MEIDDIIKTLNAFQGEDFAIVVTKDLPEQFPYKVCCIQKGFEDEDENFIDDGKFHVFCSDWELPPHTVRHETFDTAEEALDNFLVSGKPLKNWIDDLIINEILYL